MEFDDLFPSIFDRNLIADIGDTHALAVMIIRGNGFGLNVILRLGGRILIIICI